MRLSPARLIVLSIRTLGQALLIVLGLLVLIALLIALQGQRDETRVAGAAVVLDAQRGPRDAATIAQLDRALILHRQESVSQIVLTGGEAADQSQQYLADRGAIGNTVLLSGSATSLPERLALAVETARSGGASSVIVVGEPWELLRALKITRDLGMNAYGSPARIVNRGRSPLDDASTILRESWGYLTYLFAGR